MTAKYSQSVEQRGLRTTVTVEILPDAYAHFEPEAVKAAIQELTKGDRTIVVDQSRPMWFDPKRRVEFPSVVAAIKQHAEDGHHIARNALYAISGFIVDEIYDARKSRADVERESHEKLETLGQTAAELAAQNTRIAEEKAALEKQLASAIAIRDEHAAANSNLSDKLVAAKEALRKVKEAQKVNKHRNAQKTGAIDKKASGKKA